MNTTKKFTIFAGVNGVGKSTLFYSEVNRDLGIRLISCKNGGYPLIYERKDEKQSILVAINPGINTGKVDRVGEILLAQNCVLKDGEIVLGAKSFVIMQQL